MGLIEASQSQGTTPPSTDPLRLGEIVENGLCIGCGLCRSMAGAGHIDMVMTPEGRERPVARKALNRTTLAKINAVCPGTRIAGPPQMNEAALTDTVWGPVERLVLGRAGDPTVRFIASGGGTLTALGQFLLNSGRVKFVLHVAASRSMPMRTERQLSFDAASVLEGAGSRYGPAATLVDFNDILDRGEPFALIAKGATVAGIGTALALLFAGGAAGKFACGLLAERVGVIRTVVLTEAATAAGILAVLATPLPAALGALLPMGIALNGTSSVLYGTVADLVMPERRSRAYGLYYTLSVGASSLAPAAYGLVSDAAGVSVTLTIIAGFVLVTIPLCLALRPAVTAPASA
jgi:hypothetical protein